MGSIEQNPIAKSLTAQKKLVLESDRHAFRGRDCTNFDFIHNQF
jgi:hypothetical protein